ncbi:methionine ABC transporter ATP-binding protein [Lacrimispora sp.]|uniref:methionine ABC transporter ATP-binding protein n=1 Tax=Lacrimispora sp. TaxID=2719234 RepID=UPI002FD9EE39
MIEIQNVSKRFDSASGEVLALRQVSLTVEKGDIFGVIGFSGAGKSTLVRLVNLLERPSEGRVLVDGTDITTLSMPDLRKLRKNIGMIFQQFNLLQSKSVFQNIAAPLILNKVPKQEIDRRVKELLQFVELEDKANTNVSRLSGGQKQRVGIARALATNPSILLCDEATSALDPKTTDSILELLKKINRELNVTILLITHEMNVICNVCTKVAVMDSGSVLEQGTVLEVFGNPQHKITKSFVKTVINDSIPQSLVQNIRNNQNESRIFRLRFQGDTAGKPLLYRISTEFHMENSILFATVCELQGVVFSIMIVQVFGSKQKLDEIQKFIEDSSVQVEVLSLTGEGEDKND